MAPQTHAFLFSMVETGQFSDFTLVCDSHEFKLHQVVVCPQSPVIAAALCGGFQETASKVINVNEFDISTVLYMISFLYTGEYQVETKSEDTPTSTNEQSHDETDSFLKPYSDLESTENRITEVMLSHLRVNAIADYYNVESLAESAKSKIKAILAHGQEADLFPRVIQEMSKANRDEELCAIVASATAECMGELIKLQDFQHMAIEHTLVFEMLRALTEKIKKIQIQLKGSELLAESFQNFAAEESEAHELFEEGVDKSLNRLENTKTCRHCGNGFGCFFEKNGLDSSVSYVLRCRDCRCRHQ